MNAPPTWGLNVIVEIQPTIGDVADGWLLNFGPELGVCVYAAGGEAAHQCGLDLMAEDDCVYSICADVCPIPNPGTGPINQAAETDLNNCIDTVIDGACSSLRANAQTDCAPFTNAANNGIEDTCLKLLLQTYNTPQEESGGVLNEPEAGPATTTGEAQILELACGGGDAGF